MKLIECYIENFGRLSSFSYHFNDGMNVLCEKNGWGKSTFAWFIKAMLYGLGSSRSQNLSQNERQRFLPWQGGLCGGSLTFETDDGARYRVERTFGQKESDDTFRLFDGVTGAPSSAFTAKLGEELFGIDAVGYEKSTYISEKLTAEANGDYTGIQAKLVDMQDLSDFKIAIDRLDKRRKYYRVQGGRGAIYDIDQKLARLRDDLARSEEALTQVSTLNQKSKQYAKACADKELELRTLRQQTEASIAARSARALSAHAAELSETYRGAREHTAACITLLAGNPPTLQKTDEMIRNAGALRDKKTPVVPEMKYPALLPILLFIAGVLLIPAGILLHKLHLVFPILGSVLGVLFIGGGVLLSYLKRKRTDEIARAKADREDFDRITGEIASFLSAYPAVPGNTPSEGCEKRLWAIREKVEEYRMAMHDEEQAKSQYEAFRLSHPEQTAPRGTNDGEEELRRQEEEIQKEVDHLRAEQNACEREVARYTADAGAYTARAQEISSLEAKRREYQASLDTILAASDFLKAAHANLTTRYLGEIQLHFRHYMQLLTGEQTDAPTSDEYAAETYTVTPDFAVNISRFGQTKPSEALSRGGRDLVALCLRFAISDALFGGKKPFLILDDPFINLDDEKVKYAMALLSRIAGERQILYICCHTSRAKP
ncbi:MAG: ATP-binding protein [Eubacteriales bacterium]